MASKIRVTIGICVRNAERTIQDAIESVTDQDFPNENTEVIFVDDGSTDDTLSIIENHVSKMDVQARVFHHEWKGLGVSRNIVVNKADGDFIVWVDGDMILPKDFVKEQVKFMEQNPTVGIGKGKYGIYKEVSLVATLENVECLVDDFKCSEEKPLGAGGSVYRAKAIRQVGGFDEKLIGVGEDMDLEKRVRKAGWLLARSPAVFYEVRRETWKALWDEYFWHGCGAYQIVHKNGVHSLTNLHKMFPPTAVQAEFSRSLDAYRLVHRKSVFLLPFHWIFKRTAWLFGYITSFFNARANRRRI